MNYPMLLDFFDRFINEDTEFFSLIDNCEAAERIEVAEGNDEHGFVFTLKALHALIDQTNSITYTAFRTMVYDSTLNKDLKDKGYHIDIYRNTGKVDANYYRLVKL